MFETLTSPRTLSQEIEQRIELAIRQKQLGIGEKLPSEKELCSMFNVSRTALREALQALNARNLVTIRKGSGVFVNDYSSLHASKPMGLFLELNFDKNYIFHLIHVRQVIEPVIAREAAKNRSEQQDLALRSIVERMEKTEIHHELAKLDLAFHSELAEASGNPILALIMKPVFQLMPKVKLLMIRKVKQEARYTAAQYHQEICDAITVQDAVRAERAMMDHLKVAEKDANLLMDTLKPDEELYLEDLADLETFDLNDLTE